MLFVHLEGTYATDYHRDKGTLAEFLARTGNNLGHPDYSLHAIVGVYAPHNMLGGIIQPGKEAVYIHFLYRQLAGIGG
ncbi:hypothetical protein ES707_10180 [subsurface metagenome]